MDETYQIYLNRVMRMTLPETYRSQAQHIQESPKFSPRPDQPGRQAAPFPGYTVITPPGPEDTHNAALYLRLKTYQQEILEKLGEGRFVPIPPESFHLTLADLIWDASYRHAAEKLDFEQRLQHQIGQSFQHSRAVASEGKPIRCQVVGLMVMTRAIAISLVPPAEVDYDRLVKFRRSVYQNHELIGLGIEQQYYFTPHITLGYFGEIGPEQEREALGSAFDELNQHWLEGDAQEFWVHRAELRKFDDMTRYYRQPDWPTLSF